MLKEIWFICEYEINNVYEIIYVRHTWLSTIMLCNIIILGKVQILFLSLA